MRSQETELQTKLLALQQENTRLNDLMNQILSASESMDIYKVLDERSNQRPRNSNLVALRLKFRICEVRWRGINLQMGKTRTML